ncbi:MAG: hypothetical protein ACYC49_15555, partial [Ignavibacteriaceae bacterium]
SEVASPNPEEAPRITAQKFLLSFASIFSLNCYKLRKVKLRNRSLSHNTKIFISEIHHAKNY